MAKVSTDGKSTEEKMALADEISRGYFRQGLNWRRMCSSHIYGHARYRPP